VTPEAEGHLDKARESLIKARGLLDVMHHSEEAARVAYFAVFHAVQALISERTDRIATSHRGRADRRLHRKSPFLTRHGAS
jgi:uncharacterized protein (UPF0332 family)